MYCNKCGSFIDEGQKFCSVCGNNTKGHNGKLNQSKLFPYSIYLMIATSPLMLILRMLTQEGRTKFSWKKYTEYFVPNNYKVIMVILAMSLLGTSIYLFTKSGVKSRMMIMGYIITVIISCIIIFG